MPLPTVANSVLRPDRWAASRDLWPGGTLQFWKGIEAPLPERVFWPETPEQVVEVLREASERGLPVVPYGAGSGVCGGARGRQGSWVVDTKRLQQIEHLDEESWSIRVEAGVNGQQLEDHLQAAGFTLGHSPSSISCSTVGGWAAARSAGQFSSKYGVFEDMVLGLTLATPAGLLDLGCHGDDDPTLLPLVLGSEGTLGVITSVTMRIWRNPETRWLRGYRFRTMEAALEAMRRLMQAELWPSVVRLYDPVDTRIGGKTRPKQASTPRHSFVRSWLKRAADLDPVRKRSLVLPLALPSLINTLFDGLAQGCLVIVGWEGTPEVVEALTREGTRILGVDGEDLGPEPGQRWYDSRHAVSYKLMPVFERGGFADTMEVAARWSELPKVYAAVREAVRPHALIVAHMSHVYPEGGSIYFSFAGQGEQDAYQAVWKAAQDAVLASGATIAHHHGVGSLKAPWASLEVGAAVQGWKDLKRQLDPHGILNPGRLFVTTPPRDAGAPPRLHETDGLVRCPVDSTLEQRARLAAERGMELMFPWQTLPAPRRWTRSHWSVGWTEVSGRVEARRALLGRGPRSAVGPDLRGWLAAQGDCSCTVPVVPAGIRWMGRGTCPNPWAVARELLRSDLRPSVLHVVDGVLEVGFRGPAAQALGELANRWVPGGLTPCDYRAVPLPSGDLVACTLDHPDVVSVTAQGAFRVRP